jgi:DNA-binding MurR/RpiR family transcriptional regulator
MTSSELTRKAGVGETTANRLAQTLGYSGYSEFQKEIQKELRKKLSVLEKWKQEQDSEDVKNLSLWQKTLKLEQKLLAHTINSIETVDFESAVDFLDEAEEIITIASQSEQCFTEFCGYYFSIFKNRVHKLNDISPDSYHALENVKTPAVCLACCFSRYANSTLQMLEHLQKNTEAKIIVFTDKPSSPVVQYADIFFQIPENHLSLIDSFGATLSLTHALINAVIDKDRRKNYKAMEKFDKFLAKNNFYHLSEISIHRSLTVENDD